LTPRVLEAGPALLDSLQRAGALVHARERGAGRS
jgi:hypothetical protein